ncbi:MAG TPA: STAS domain-containing protein [Labilithrix sp.]|nr:STAS domain-containing protein [Labilithrix sp.]
MTARESSGLPRHRRDGRHSRARQASTIQKNGASVVIIDSTGVPTVDTGVIEHLLRTVHAVKLLGARAVLVGISPAIAQTMVQLGVDFGGLTTLGNLQAGVAYALRHIGFEIRARA